MSCRARITPLGFLWAAVVLSGVGGCTTYSFKIDSVRNEGTPTGTSFKIVCVAPEFDDNDPLVVRAKAAVETALSSKGMYEAPDNVVPDLVIEIDFGMEPPNSHRYFEQDLFVPSDPQTSSGGGNSSPSGRWVRYDTFPKYMRITARESEDESDSGSHREVWSVYITNEDESADLDDYIPLMVSAAMDSLGQANATVRKVRISNHDKRVEFVLQGMP